MAEIASCGTDCKELYLTWRHPVGDLWPWPLKAHDVITSLPAGVFDHLTQLEVLDLNRNEITSLQAGVFDHLTQLRFLNLYSNKITSLEAGVFDHLTQLHGLFLGDNEISSIEAGVFDHLTQLQGLHLQFNEISSLPAGVFDHLTQLQYLELKDNKLTALPAGVFDHLGKIRWLTLFGNPWECRVLLPTDVWPSWRIPDTLNLCSAQDCRLLKGKVCKKDPNCEWKHTTRTCVAAQLNQPPSSTPEPTATPTATPTFAPASTSHCGSLKGKACTNDPKCEWEHKTKTC